MSGSKRKSAYRKSVVSSYENEFPEPQSELGEVICKIVGSRGANIFEVVTANSEDLELVVLPRRFVNLIWVKRNDFVIIERGVEESSEHKEGAQTILYLIKHILGREQIAHLKKAGLWPTKFDDRSGRGRGGGYAEDMSMIYSSATEADEDETYVDVQGDCDAEAT